MTRMGVVLPQPNSKSSMRTPARTRLPLGKRSVVVGRDFENLQTLDDIDREFARKLGGVLQR